MNNRLSWGHIVAFFIVLLTFGMETTFFRFVNKAENKEKTFNQATTLVLILSVVFFFTIAVFSQGIANWMGYPNQQNFVLWFGAILSIDAMWGCMFRQFIGVFIWLIHHKGVNHEKSSHHFIIISICLR